MNLGCEQKSFQISCLKTFLGARAVMEDFAVMFKVSIDSTFTRIGFGVYQRKVFALLCFVGISFSIIDTGPVFWAHSPQLHCSRGHHERNLNLSTRNDNISHTQTNETLIVNLKSNSTKSDELRVTISPENNVTFDESSEPNGNVSGKSNPLPVATISLDYEDIFVYHETGHKCTISIDEGLLIVHSGNTRQHCHDPTPDYKISTIAARVGLIVSTIVLSSFFCFGLFCSGVAKEYQSNLS